MGDALFPLPDSPSETIRLLNLQPDCFSNFSLWMEPKGLLLFAGDQPIFEPATAGELHAFLAGAFLMAYSGQSVKDIVRTVEPGQNSG
jgi:hypothetical protein